MTVSDSGAHIQPTLDLAEARWWIEFLHGDSPGLIHISGAGEWAGRTFNIDDMDQLLEYVQKLDARGVAGIYLRACTLGTTPRGGGRGSEHDSLAFPGFWADMDLEGPGHKTTQRLPSNVYDCKAILEESGLPEPSLWVHSGGGLYPWWILHRPVELTETDVFQKINPTALEHIKLMSQQWQDVIAAAAARRGWHYGTGVGDLARVLRLPGTINRKVAHVPAKCQVIEQDGVAYTLEQLEAGLQVALARLDRVTPQPLREQEKEYVSFQNPSDGITPFDDYEMRTDWADILEPAGWRESHRIGRTRYWVRPGKNPRDGHSATTGHSVDRDRLYVFSTETPFMPGASYTKPAAYAVMACGGDMKAAAKSLAAQGYGTKGTKRQLYEFNPGNLDDAHGNDSTVTIVENSYRMNDTGNAERLVHRVGHKYRYMEKEKLWYLYDGTRWVRDEFGSVHHEMKAVTEDIYAEADACSDVKMAEKMTKFATSSGNTPRVNGSVEAFRRQPGMSIPAGSFDKNSNLLNLFNGTLDLTTLELQPHKSSDMLSKQFHARYDPSATAPNWCKFLEEAIPDVDSREYLQRALGYSLLGEADQRKLFLIWGPSGTGKSQLIRTIQLLFGDYGASAAPSTFKVRKGEIISNDIHDLRGKRFVATSETSADTLIDEELVKRFTGNDLITSRGLYQENQSWRPNCVIWMATNHLPNLNSDDDAIWHRIRTVYMGTVFAGRDEEIGAFAERVLVPEADGILNWLLEGVLLYRQKGLRAEPAEMVKTLESYKVDSDTVAQFMQDSLEDQVILKDEPDSSDVTPPIEALRLYKLYAEWAANNRVNALGSRRFGLRMRRLGYESYRSNGIRWRGLRIGLRGFTGMMPLMT